MKARRHEGTKAHGYVLLETVIATGLLIVGMAVIGAQVQSADTSAFQMQLRLRAVMLAEVQLAEMDLGLIELDSVDEVQEEDFGPRYPDWAWRMTIEKTAIEELFLLRLDVLHHRRDGAFKEDDFDFDNARIIHTVYAQRATPRPLDLHTEFGLSEDQATELSEQLSAIGEGFDLASFDPAILAKLPFDELVEVLPPLLEAFHIPVDTLASSLPPDVRRMLEESGLLGGEDGEGGDPHDEDGRGRAGTENDEEESQE